jgi:hypothetical protein
VFVGGEGGGRITGDLGRQLRPALVPRFTPQRFATLWIARPDAADIAKAMRTLERGTVRGKIAVTQ